MIYNILYLILAALGLGVLVFIHELGHYFVARREGMKIETFSIGFGKPIASWERDGVKWQVCWIPVGGYVRIAGMEKKGSVEPYQIPDGFFGKKPMARIRVALAGPFVNIVFGFLLFCLIWVSGGREEPFAKHTDLIGWVEPQSELAKMGVHPGDAITSYGGKPLLGFYQLAYGALLDQGAQVLTGEKINYVTGKKEPFSYTVRGVEDAMGRVRPLSLLSSVGPAGYLIYQPDGMIENPPMKASGIRPGDRVIWVDGQVVFSRAQLSFLVNEPRVLLTVKRGEEIFLTRVPRLQISDLRLQSKERMELQDAAYAKGLKGDLSQLYFLPYVLSTEAVVDYPLAYVDEEAVEREKFVSGASPSERALEPGDRILAVDETRVQRGSDVLSALQKRHVQVIVQRESAYPLVSWKEANEEILEGVSFQDLTTLSLSIAEGERLPELGNLVLLSPIEPRPLSAFSFSDTLKEQVESQVALQKKQIEEIRNPKERAKAAKEFEREQNKLLLGGVFEDRMVKYNPSPVVLFQNFFDEMYRTLRAVFTGYISPKHMAGPVGIVQVMQKGWGAGVKEALYWIAAISLNLGFVNLLPIPVLDGGHICFAVYEMVTKRQIKAKVMEKLILPFVLLIVAFFIYATYHDILRIFFPSF